MIKIVPFTENYITEVKKFLDIYSGEDYLTEIELKNIVKNKSVFANMNASFLALNKENKVIAIRISYAPSKWINKNIKGLSFDKWTCHKDTVAKFHCLFVDKEYQGQGIGPKLSNESILHLKEMGAKAIICHSWLESPNNSSQRYLKKYGFESVSIHKDFWKELDYFCSGCSLSPCICSAEEMILYL